MIKDPHGNLIVEEITLVLRNEQKDEVLDVVDGVWEASLIGNVVIIPSKPGYLFEPAAIEVDQAGQDLVFVIRPEPPSFELGRYAYRVSEKGLTPFPTILVTSSLSQPKYKLYVANDLNGNYQPIGFNQLESDLLAVTPNFLGITAGDRKYLKVTVVSELGIESALTDDCLQFEYREQLHLETPLQDSTIALNSTNELTFSWHSETNTDYRFSALRIIRQEPREIKTYRFNETTTSFTVDLTEPFYCAGEYNWYIFANSVNEAGNITEIIGAGSVGNKFVITD